MSYQSRFLVILIPILILTFIGCSNADSLATTNDDAEWQDISEIVIPAIAFDGLPNNDQSQLPEIISDDLLEDDLLKDEQTEIDDESLIAESKKGFSTEDARRLHDELNGGCPKQIILEVDSDSMENNQDIIRHNHCDYYLYPSKGQKISVEISPNLNIEAFLVTPIIYDFNNGSYDVVENDTHIIRVAYTGHYHYTEPTNYKFIVRIES